MGRVSDPDHSTILIAKGEKRWLAKGEKRGLKKGALAMLSRLLEKRFGPLESTIKHRLEKATLAQLARWQDRALEAATLAQVFARARAAKRRGKRD